MQCFGCSKKYGLFTKEYGCPNCGYSYCAKCLKRPVAVPKHGGKVENVCLICFDRLSKVCDDKVVDCESLPGTIVTKATKGRYAASQAVAAAAIFEAEPPADLAEVMLPLSREPGTSKAAARAANSATDEINENLDSEFSKRLKKLIGLDEVPSDDEIRVRLAKLKGIDPTQEHSTKDVLLSTDQRTDQAKVNDLLEQFMGETYLNARVEDQRTEDIRRRLKELRSGASNADTSKIRQPSFDDEDEEQVLKRIVETYMRENPSTSNDLENEFMSSLPQPTPGEATEELPWCSICNEDAVFRCKGCEGELFCAQCYRESHDDDEEYRMHVKESYSAPSTLKEDHF